MRTDQRILFGVASLRRNKVDRGKARVCHFAHFGPYREYRKNEAARRRTKSFGIVRNLVSPYRMCPASFSFSGLDGAETTLFPAMTPTIKNIHPRVAGQIWVTYAARARAWQLKTGHIRWQFKTNCKTGINFTVYCIWVMRARITS